MRPDLASLREANEPQQVYTAADQRPDAAARGSASPSTWPKVIPGEFGDPRLLELNQLWPQQSSENSGPDMKKMKGLAAIHWRFLSLRRIHYPPRAGKARAARTSLQLFSQRAKYSSIGRSFLKASASPHRSLPRNPYHFYGAPPHR
jgi:hypothetical protein